MAPELAVSKGLEQWIEACCLIKALSGNGCLSSPTSNCLLSDIPERYPNVQWTETHGMMACMGGFELVKDDDPKKMRLSYENIEHELEGYEVDFSTITKDLIMDRSKGDAVTKALVILQTSWFAVQCAARVGSGLPVTELEVTTLGYTALICFIYILWWNKPLHVVYPITLHAKHLEDRAGLEADGGDATSLELSRTSTSPLMTTSTPTPRPSLKLSWRIQFGIDIYVNLQTGKRSAMTWMYRMPIVPVMGMFGAIHCFAWNSHFPSRVEQTLWRVSALIVTVCPIISFLFEQAARDLLVRFFDGVAWTGLCLYCGARLCLLTIAFLALRALPFAAYQTTS